MNTAGRTDRAVRELLALLPLPLCPRLPGPFPTPNPSVFPPDSSTAACLLNTVSLPCSPPPGRVGLGLCMQAPHKVHGAWPQAPQSHTAARLLPAGGRPSQEQSSQATVRPPFPSSSLKRHKCLLATPRQDLETSKVLPDLFALSQPSTEQSTERGEGGTASRGRGRVTVPCPPSPAVPLRPPRPPSPPGHTPDHGLGGHTSAWPRPSEPEAHGVPTALSPAPHPSRSPCRPTVPGEASRSSHSGCHQPHRPPQGDFWSLHLASHTLRRPCLLGA